MVPTAPATGACKGCKGGEEPFVSQPTGGGGRDGIALEPFPRQVLVGNSVGPVVYLGPIYDATHWKSIAWWFEVYAGLLGTAGAPATAYLDTSENMDGPWTELIPGGEAGAIGVIDAGSVMNPSRYVRAAISARAGDTVAVALRLVARTQ
jgi:hypothetical protein